MHTLALVFSAAYHLPSTHITVDASSAPVYLVVTSCAIRALIITYMGEEEQERRL